MDALGVTTFNPAPYTRRSPHPTKSGPGRRRLLGKPTRRLARATAFGLFMPNGSVLKTYAEHDAAVTARLNLKAWSLA